MEYQIKNIEGFEHYQIDTNGTLWSSPNSCHKETIKIEGYLTKGYPTVFLFNLKGQRFFRSIHRIVAEAFIPNPENKPQVNHINGVRNDNRLENLEWCTQSENMLHAYRCLGAHVAPKFGENNHSAILTEAQVLAIRADPRSSQIIAKEFNVGKHVIYFIKRRITWAHLPEKSTDVYNHRKPKITREQATSIFFDKRTSREIAAAYGISTRHAYRLKKYSPSAVFLQA